MAREMPTSERWRDMQRRLPWGTAVVVIAALSAVSWAGVIGIVAVFHRLV
jgi:hypothetical protein